MIRFKILYMYVYTRYIFIYRKHFKFLQPFIIFMNTAVETSIFNGNFIEFFPHSYDKEHPYLIKIFRDNPFKAGYIVLGFMTSCISFQPLKGEELT